MMSVRYRPLTRDELDALLTPGAEDVAEGWDRLTGSLHVLLQLKTRTYPRPLIPEASARAEIPAALQELDGTQFYPRALENAHAIEEIERRFREHGPSPELYRAVDDCIEAMLEEWNAIQYYPEPPPVLTPLREPGPRFEPHYATGGR